MTDTVARIQAAGRERIILLRDLGMAVLLMPMEGVCDFLLAIWGAGFSNDEIRAIVVEKPTQLYKVGRDGHDAVVEPE